MVRTTTIALFLTAGLTMACGDNSSDTDANATDSGATTDTGSADAQTMDTGSTDGADTDLVDSSPQTDTPTMADAPMTDSATPDSASPDSALPDSTMPDTPIDVDHSPEHRVRFGLAVNGVVDPVSGAEEPFEEQLAFVDQLGTEFINLPLDWRTLEPGPSDDFRFAQLDTNRWDTSATAPQRVADCDPEGAGDDPCLRWEMTESDQAWIRTRYVLEGDYSAEVRWRLPPEAAVGSTATLLLNAIPERSDNRCEAGDRYLALVLAREEGENDSISVAQCAEGSFTVLTTALFMGDAATGATVRIARQGNQIQMYAGELNTPLYTVEDAPLTSVRPWLYVNGRVESPGDVVVEVDAWSVGASPNRFDAPELRYSIDPGFFDVLGVVNLIYRDRPLSISIRTINTNRTELPNDLEALIDPATGRVAFDDPRVLDRFEALLGHLFGRLDDALELVLVSVGNEIDIYLGDNLAAWQAWTTFAQAAMPLAREALDTLQDAPDVPVGAKLTEQSLGLSPSVQDQIDAMVAASDAVMVNYYPTDPGFVLVSDASVMEAIEAIDTRFETFGKPLMLTEFGVHSVGAQAPVCALNCTVCNGSEMLQAERYNAFFAALDAHPRFTLVMLNWLTDVPCSTLDGWAVQYGSAAPSFLGFLGSLGLRRRDGAPKPAFDTVRNALDERGWAAER